MKFLLMAFITIAGFSQAHAASLKLGIGCPFYKENLDPIPQIQSARAWSLCSKIDLQAALTQLNIQVNADVGRGKHVEEANYPDKYKRILNAIKFAQGLVPDGLVSVTSEHLDLRTQKLKTVQGVGSLIATGRYDAMKMINAWELMDARYFVLTAGHVSMGRNLIVKSIHGPLPVKGVYQDAKTDLSLIEIDMSRLNYLPMPLGYYVGDKANPYASGYIISFLQEPFDSNRNMLTDMYSDFTYEVKFIDSLKGYMNSRGGLSGVLYPLWLKPPGGQEISISSYQLPRGAVSEITLLHRFPRGFSGAPIQIAYPFGGIHLFNLAGVLTLSSMQGSNSAKGTGPVSTASFIDTILKGKYKFDQNTKWFLIDGTFARLQNDITVYLRSGPIGNGIIIDGYASPATLEGAKEDLRRQMLKNGLTLDEANKVLKILQDSKPESLNKGSLNSKLELRTQ